MGHDHDHSHAMMGPTLIASILLTLSFVAYEVFAGYRAGSLALLSDAGHNFADAFALMVAAFGFYLQSRPGDHVKTFGYHRAGVLAAFVNALALVLLAAILFYESYRRLLQPQPVAEGTMMTAAAIGLCVNLLIVWKLGGHGHDVNLRAAWIHMLGDALSCAAIIVGAVVIRFTGWHIIDPALSILIGVMIVASAWGIIEDSLNILLEGLPKGLKLDEVTGGIRRVPGVLEVHDLHIWSIGSQTRALCCHVLIDDLPPSASDSVLRDINDMLCERFSIHHTTIQFEHVRCALAEAPCTLAHQHQH